MTGNHVFINYLFLYRNRHRYKKYIANSIICDFKVSQIQKPDCFRNLFQASSYRFYILLNAKNSFFSQLINY